MGPWLVRVVVRWLHRHSAYVDLADLAEMDWDAGVIRVDPRRMQPVPPNREQGPIPTPTLSA